MLDTEKDPALEPESTAAGGASEDTTTDKTTVPPVEEEPAEPANEETAEAKPEGDAKKEPEHYEIFLDGEEDAAPPAPKDSAAWARMRKAEQEAKAEAARLKRELEAAKASTTTGAASDPGPEPTIESCDYDEALLKARLREYDRNVAQHEAEKAKAAERATQQHREAQGRVDAYNVARVEALAKYPGYEAAETTVGSALTADRLDVLVRNAGNLTRVVYALGQRPELLEKFARETDRDRLVAELVKLEVSMKERKKGTQAPPPERSPRGAGAPGADNSTLERLRAKAEKTGDYTEVNAWKRKQREPRK